MQNNIFYGTPSKEKNIFENICAYPIDKTNLIKLKATIVNEKNVSYWGWLDLNYKIITTIFNDFKKAERFLKLGYNVLAEQGKGKIVKLKIEKV